MIKDLFFIEFCGVVFVLTPEEFKYWIGIQQSQFCLGQKKVILFAQIGRVKFFVIFYPLA